MPWKSHDARERWKHLTLSGQAHMARGCMISIIGSETATDEAKNIAFRIRDLTEELLSALKEKK